MNTEILVDQGEVIGYVLVGVIAFVGLAIIQLIRRRRDLKRARLAVHLVSLSISEPRVGPIAVTGSYHEAGGERWLQCSRHRVALGGELDVVRGARARWQGGVRTYEVRDGDTVIAIGVMSKAAVGNDDGWRLGASAGEAGIQLYATKPAAAPPPLWPWRALVFLAVSGGLGFGALYGTGTVLLDVPRRADATPCTDNSRLRFELVAAVPLLRAQALIELERCRKSSPVR